MAAKAPVSSAPADAHHPWRPPRYPHPVTRRIDVALLPSEAELIGAQCYVLVDLLRATTTIATLFAGGLDGLVAVDALATARERAAADSALLIGEVGGLPPEGFDAGNSPVEVRDLELAGRRAVLFTTNGTRALCSLAPLGAVYAGSLANLSAVCTAVSRFDRVAVVCAGEAGGRRFAQEDFAAAGTMVRSLLRLSPGAEIGDAAGLAMSHVVYEDGLRVGLPQQTAASQHLVAGAEHARHLFALGLSADVHFAAQVDTSPAAPCVVAHGRGWAALEA